MVVPLCCCNYPSGYPYENLKISFGFGDITEFETLIREKEFEITELIWYYEARISGNYLNGVDNFYYFPDDIDSNEYKKIKIFDDYKKIKFSEYLEMTRLGFDHFDLSIFFTTYCDCHIGVFDFSSGVSGGPTSIIHKEPFSAAGFEKEYNFTISSTSEIPSIIDNIIAPFRNEPISLYNSYPPPKDFDITVDYKNKKYLLPPPERYFHHFVCSYGVTFEITPYKKIFS